MNILITNDDGIYADGILALYQKLKTIADITVVAPDSEKSSIGHAITLAHPILYKKVKRKGKFFGYGISGTPADCVKFGISVLLKKKPDVIVSGINIGANDGCSVFYSGTVAGAREGALLGIPSIAISLEGYWGGNFANAAEYAATLVKIIQKNPLPKMTFLNVNVPNASKSEIKGIRWTRQGLEPIHSTFFKRKDPNSREYYWMSGKIPTKDKDINLDTYALKQKYVTAVPVYCDVTNYEYLQKMNSKN